MASVVGLSNLAGSSDSIEPLTNFKNELEDFIQCCDANKGALSKNTRLITMSIGDLLQEHYDRLVSIANDERECFLRFVLDKLEPLRVKLEQHSATKILAELDDQVSTLKLLCDTDFNQKPLDFVEKCREHMNLWNSYEQEVIGLIRKLNQIRGLEDVLKTHLDAIENARKKLVIAFLGSLKATKSSFVNFLLQEEVCPTGNEAATARLTKITYGDRMKVTRRTRENQSETIYCSNYKELLAKATEYIKLSSDQRSIECKDEIIIELPIDALKNVELWDIPGFDENQVIDNRIKEIIEDADLIFALIPHQDSLRKSFQYFIQPRLSKQENDGHSDELTVKHKTAMICFIVTQIDTFKINIQTNKSRDVVLTDLYHTLEKELGITFEATDMKSCNNFIPMCTHQQFDIKTFLECRKMFIEKSSQWFMIAVQRLAYFRLSYLLNVVQQLIEYGDATRILQSCRDLKRHITKCYVDFESKIPNFVKEAIQPIEKEVINSIPEIIKQYDTSEYPNDSARSKKFDDIIRERVTTKFMDVLKQHDNSIKTRIQELLIEHELSLELNPAEAQLYEQIVADIHLNPYRLGVGYFENARMLGAKTDGAAGLATVVGFAGYGSFIAGLVLFEAAPVAGPILLLGGLLGFIQLPLSLIVLDALNGIGWSFNILTIDRLEEAMKKCVRDVNKALYDNLVNSMQRFSESRLRAFTSKIDEKTSKVASLSETHTRGLSKFIEENKLILIKLCLDLLSQQFKLTHPDCQISTERLGASTLEIFPTRLHLPDNTILDLAATKISLHRFNLQKIRYLKQVHHRNIVKYYGVLKRVLEEDFYYIITDRMNGDLCPYSIRILSEMKEEKILKTLYQITEALCYIHQQDLIHGDIKPANILFKMSDEQPLVYLADFGYLHRDPLIPGDTSKYLAPELTNQKLGAITDKADVYSWGVTIKELIGDSSYSMVQNSARLQKWLATANKCMEKSPSDRPSCKEILKIYSQSAK